MEACLSPVCRKSGLSGYRQDAENEDQKDPARKEIGVLLDLEVINDIEPVDDLLGTGKRAGFLL